MPQPMPVEQPNAKKPADPEGPAGWNLASAMSQGRQLRSGSVVYSVAAGSVGAAAAGKVAGL